MAGVARNGCATAPHACHGVEHYLADFEAQAQRRQRAHATYNKVVAVLASFGAWLVAAGHSTETPARRLRTLPEQRVPAPKHVGALLQAYLDYGAKQEQQRPTHGPLLVGERGGITRTTINRIVARVAACARLTDAERRQVTPRALRHTVATRLVRTRDLVTAADLLGHSSLTTTRRYAKASVQEVAAAVEALYDA